MRSGLFACSHWSQSLVGKRATYLRHASRRSLPVLRTNSGWSRTLPRHHGDRRYPRSRNRISINTVSLQLRRGCHWLLCTCAALTPLTQRLLPEAAICALADGSGVWQAMISPKPTYGKRPRCSRLRPTTSCLPTTCLLDEAAHPSLRCCAGQRVCRLSAEGR